jgi:hypothetical protein
VGQAPHLPPPETALSLATLAGVVYLWLRRLGMGRSSRPES